MKRFIQIYTGNGKGKTTAAIGHAIRSAGSGLKTYMVMFMKDYPYGEVKTLRHLAEWITVEQFGNDSFVFKKEPPSKNDCRTASTALDKARDAMTSGKYDIIILDEICVAVYFGLLQAESVTALLDNKPDNVELILTGRYCPQEWLERADLVTEMNEVKHYYQQGILARKGFES